MGQLLQLYQLQSLDNDIDKTTKALAEIEANLGESEAIKAAQITADVAEQDLRKTQTIMQDLDLEVKSLTEKITNQEKKLYSGSVISAKEAGNLQEEVASLKRWHTQREESLLEAMLTVEEAEENFAQTQTELANLKTTWSTEQKMLLGQQQVLLSQLENLQKRRPVLLNQVNQDDLMVYEKLRPKKAGRVVAVVKGGVCQGCGMTPSHSKIQQARAGNELMYCGACGRILYVP